MREMTVRFNVSANLLQAENRGLVRRFELAPVQQIFPSR